MTDVRADFAALAEATFRHYKRTPQVRTPTWWRLLSDPALVALQDSGISLNPIKLHAEQIVPDMTSFVEQALHNFEDLCAVLDGQGSI